MKKMILVMLILLSWVGVAGAQSTSHYVRAQIPFDFQVNGQNLAAGTYDFCWNRSFVAAIRLADQKVSATALTYAKITDVQASTGVRTAKVIFRRIGGMYALSAIHQPDEGIVTLSPTKRRMNEEVAEVEIPAKVGK